jgi:hypothetical protein
LVGSPLSLTAAARASPLGPVYPSRCSRTRPRGGRPWYVFYRGLTHWLPLSCFKLPFFSFLSIACFHAPGQLFLSLFVVLYSLSFRSERNHDATQEGDRVCTVDGITVAEHAPQAHGAHHRPPRSRSCRDPAPHGRTWARRVCFGE